MWNLGESSSVFIINSKRESAQRLFYVLEVLSKNVSLGFLASLVGEPFLLLLLVVGIVTIVSEGGLGIMFVCRCKCVGLSNTVLKFICKFRQLRTGKVLLLYV